jgi:nucleoside-diphosphate-sugar epimerase
MLISKSKLDEVEVREIIEKLYAHGHGDLVECLLSNESKVYTKKGRLNKSSTCRELGWKPKQLEDALREMRELLKELAGD